MSDMENEERLSGNQQPIMVDGQPVRMEKITVEQTLELRHSVLWPDMPLSQVCLPEDNLGIHLGVLLPHSVDPIVVISLFVEPLPIDKPSTSKITHPGPPPPSTMDSQCSEKAVRFRKFACSPRYQGRGLGTHLLTYALSIARSQLGATVVWCDARLSSTEWYNRRGLVRFGQTFFKGPVEYVRMKIQLPDTINL